VFLRQPKAALIGEVLNEYFTRHGMKSRIEQAKIVLEWGDLVGAKLASVCSPVMVDQSGTLWVRVKSAAWMQELQLMSPAIIHELAKRGRRVKRIRWAAGNTNAAAWLGTDGRGEERNVPTSST
jgi:predicted nucleic acid-binding Zn ribbon protein